MCDKCGHFYVGGIMVKKEPKNRGPKKDNHHNDKKHRNKAEDFKNLACCDCYEGRILLEQQKLIAAISPQPPVVPPQHDDMIDAAGWALPKFRTGRQSGKSHAVQSMHKEMTDYMLKKAQVEMEKALLDSMIKGHSSITVSLDEFEKMKFINNPPIFKGDTP